MEICKTDIKDILHNMARKIRKKFAETANGNINKP